MKNMLKGTITPSQNGESNVVLREVSGGWKEKGANLLFHAALGAAGAAGAWLFTLLTTPKDSKKKKKNSEE